MNFIKLEAEDIKKTLKYLANYKCEDGASANSLLYNGALNLINSYEMRIEQLEKLLCSKRGNDKETAEKCINIIKKHYKKCRLSIDCWIVSFAETEAAKKVIKVFFDNTEKEIAEQFNIKQKIGGTQ